METSIIPELAGGPAYSRIVTEDMADTVVTTASEIESTLENASTGEVIYVPGDEDIDMDGHINISVGANNVTLASNRGAKKSDASERSHSRGARLYLDNYSTDHPDRLFRAYPDGFRLTGFRLEGPEPDYIDTHDSTLQAAAVFLYGQDEEIDNCELFAWPFTPITSGGQDYPDTTVHVHHNHIHRNRLQGLGYGIDVYNGHALLEFNYLNFHRHSIAALGYPENSWEARYNVVGPAHHGHIFDIHNIDESTSEPSGAGDFLDAHHNTFLATQELGGEGDEAVKLRGVSDSESTVMNNWFRHANRPTPPGEEWTAYHQQRVDDWTNFTPDDNHFGTSMPDDYFRGAQRFVACDHLVEYTIEGDDEPLGIEYDPRPQIYDMKYKPE